MTPVSYHTHSAFSPKTQPNLLSEDEQNELNEIRQMCGNYLDHLPLLENIVESIRRGDFCTSKNITISNVTFSVGKNVELVLPENITLEDCELSSGRVYFHRGTMAAIDPDAIVFACGEHAVAIAAGKNTKSYAIVNGAVARATGAGASAYAGNCGAHAHADESGTFSHATAQGAKAHANNDNTTAIAYARQSEAHANAANAKAHAVGPETDAHANHNGAYAYARKNKSAAHAHTEGSQAHAMVENSFSYALEDGAFSFSSAANSRSYARKEGAQAFATSSGSEAWATVPNATSIGLHMDAKVIAISPFAITFTLNEWEEHLKLEQLREIEEWDDYVEEVVTTQKDQNKALYKKENGIYDLFIASEPATEQIITINSFLKNNFQSLKREGVKRDTNTFFLPEGVDCIMRDPFNFNDQEEWCLLKQGGNHYNFILMATAEHLINMGNNHPFHTGRALTQNDIQRGAAVVNMINMT